MVESVIDILIRNQGLVILILAFIAGVASVQWIVRPTRIYPLQHSMHLLSMYSAKSPIVSLVGSLRGFFAIVFVGGGVALFLFGWEPVPRTAGLSLPPIVKYSPKVGPGGSIESQPERNNKHLLIFVHGWRGSSNTWAKFHELAANDPNLQADLWIIDYPHFMSKRGLDINELADFMEESFKSRQVYGQYDKIAIIAHSMGGLIARRVAVLATITVGDPKPIGLLVEIGTPHEGANLAALANNIGLRGELTTDMEKNSKFLNLLAKDWSRLGERPGIRPTSRCFYSPHDRVVSPSSAKAGCDADRPYIAGGHKAIVRPDDRADYRYEFPMFRVKSYFESF